MKAVLTLLICCSCLFVFQRYLRPKRTSTQISALRIDTVNFKTQVQPIFEKHCSPCHFTGGKMYEKLPFDQGETIMNHETGILRRIKEDEDVRLIKQYVGQKRGDN